MLHGPWADPIPAHPAARQPDTHPVALATSPPEQRARDRIARMLATIDALTHEDDEDDAADAREQHRLTARR
jgi:hypothetical protein